MPHYKTVTYVSGIQAPLSYNAEAARRLPGKQFISLLLQFFENQLFFDTFILANVA